MTVKMITIITGIICNNRVFHTQTHDISLCNIIWPPNIILKTIPSTPPTSKLGGQDATDSAGFPIHPPCLAYCGNTTKPGLVCCESIH